MELYFNFEKLFFHWFQALLCFTRQTFSSLSAFGLTNAAVMRRCTDKMSVVQTQPQAYLLLLQNHHVWFYFSIVVLFFYCAALGLEADIFS